MDDDSIPAMTDKYITKKVLLRLLKTCMNRLKLEPSLEITFRAELTAAVTQVWGAFADNEHRDTDLWFSACRVGIYGLYVLSVESDDICSFVEDSFDKLHINVPVINLTLNISNQYTYKLSLVFGYLNCIIYQSDLSNEHRCRVIYRLVIAGCKLQSRHNCVYFRLLLTFAEKFAFTLDTADLDDMFELLSYNITRKEWIPLIRIILEHPKFFKTETVLHDLLTIVSWNLKLKYMLITEIISYNPTYLVMINPGEFVRAVMHSQESPYLCAAGGKMYLAAIKVVPYDDWKKHFYSTIKTILSKTGPDTPTIQQMNIIKYCLLHSLREYPVLAQCLLDDLSSCTVVPYYSILSVAILALRHNILGTHFNYRKYAVMGLHHFDSDVRNMSFEILCSTSTISGQPTTLLDVENFIAENINSADQSTRDSIRKSFEFFLKNTFWFIVKSKAEDYLAVKSIQTVFNVILESLIENIKVDSNYQRLTTSMLLIEMFSAYFPRYPDMKCSDVTREKLQEFASGLVLYRSHIRFYNKIVYMVVSSKHEQCDRVMNFIFKDIFNVMDDDIPDVDYFQMGLLQVNSHDFGLADIGMKQIRYQIRLLCEQGRMEQAYSHLQVIYDMMLDQWRNIKMSRFESIVYQKNPLHSMILLIDYSLYLFDESEFDDLFSFLEDINRYLLKAFEMRFLPTYTAKYCRGVARAMQNHNSEYNKGTTNCIWLVLRNCCRMAFNILQREFKVCRMKRCLNIIYQTMQRCNHKGALEEAGNTLSQLVEYCTENEVYLNVLDTFVSKFLDGLHKLRISTSTVRRSAETRTFLHAVATNDNRFDKPLLHAVMTYLKRELGICVHLPIANQSENKLVLHAVLLNCLQPIINDNSVEHHITEYLSDILTYCFQSFEHQWEVRNAALQTIGACANRLLGPNIAPNDQCEKRSVCLEELFYKYRNLYTFITHHFRIFNINNQIRLNTITPIVSLLGLSYTRCGIRSVTTEMNMVTLENRVMHYALHAVTNNQFNSAAKAYLAVCPPSNLERAIQLFTPALSDQGVLPENYFASIYIVEALYGHLMDNMGVIPGSAAIAAKCSERLNQMLGVICSADKYSYIVIARIILLKHRILTVDLQDLVYNLTYVCRNKDIVKEISGIWSWLSATVKHVSDRIHVVDMKPLVVLAFTEATPVLFKRIIITLLKYRIGKCSTDRQFVANEICDLLVEYIFDTTITPVKYIMDELIGIILDLDELNLSIDIVRRCCFATLSQYENGKKPDYYMPIYCMITTQYCSEDEVPEMERFAQDCLTKCTKMLNEDDYDPLIFKSIIFISRFARKHDRKPLMYSILRLCYDILQRGNSQLDDEVTKSIMFLFNVEKNHAFANILSLININNVQPLIGTHLTARLLIQIYVSRQRGAHIPAECSFYKSKKNLVISTNVILEQLVDCINCLFCDVTAEEFTEITDWFKELAMDVHNEYVDNVRNYLSYTPLDYVKLLHS